MNGVTLDGYGVDVNSMCLDNKMFKKIISIKCNVSFRRGLK